MRKIHKNIVVIDNYLRVLVVKENNTIRLPSCNVTIPAHFVCGEKHYAYVTDKQYSFKIINSSFIAIMENGSEYAGVTAEISGKLGSYNYVRADYKMIHGEQFEVSQRNTSAQYAYEANLPEGERITQVYAFVNSPS